MLVRYLPPGYSPGACWSGTCLLDIAQVHAGPVPGAWRFIVSLLLPEESMTEEDEELMLDNFLTFFIAGELTPPPVTSYDLP